MEAPKEVLCNTAAQESYVPEPSEGGLTYPNLTDRKPGRDELPLKFIRKFPNGSRLVETVPKS